MRFLRDEILRALVFAYGKAGNVGPGSRERVNRVSLRKHVAEIEDVARGEVVVNAEAELVVGLVESLRGAEAVGSESRIVR